VYAQADSSGNLKIAGTLTTTTGYYITQLDDVGGGVTYVGLADPGSATSGALWQIKQITETGADIVVLFADGDSNFDKVWDDRLSLSYS
jgi:hypothetical protein